MGRALSGFGQTKLGQLTGDAVRFGMVGAVSYVLDVALFNLLRVSHLGVFSEPLVAKTMGVALATVVAWLGTRYWTFRRNLRVDAGREFVEFVVVAGAGYAVNLLVLFLSHYVFGFRSLLADNIAGNLVGAALGAVVRFLLYRAWVYHPDRAGANSSRESDATPRTSPRGVRR